jgi:hypothetical protein
MPERKDATGAVLCSDATCWWEIPTGGFGGIPARYRDEAGNPVCWDHYTPPEAPQSKKKKKKKEE